MKQVIILRAAAAAQRVVGCGPIVYGVADVIPLVCSAEPEFAPVAFVTMVGALWTATLRALVY